MMSQDDLKRAVAQAAIVTERTQYVYRVPLVHLQKQNVQSIYS